GAYGTITLTNGELLISDCLLLLGPGATNVAVDGNAASRVFLLTNGVTATIAGLTISNGAAAAAGGGGILNQRSTLTVSNCTITGNTADGGGALFNSPGSVTTIVASTISSNTASLGGGIENVALFESSTV